ncbi:type IX secretion system membrane protein PorP/SprF [Flavobacterium aquidurense]|uniref:PorP/SprF family type IX secretion system membrane protein n=1 Tax=Flavobacterium aquidurense TaxID=362413 RepID=UPI00286079C4|nr:type IX secretion system membrane protein PorP/SprF [Flavobacterium aquidurense]MDR7372707.1 type IX secretion system PorP/SprF family membrane protein [Flavobacterium aquidurense]
MKIKKTFFAILLLTSLGSYAQQDAQYTQYMYNTINVNPAYAGSRGVMSIFGLYRTQWVGLEGAPKTGSISINSPLGKNLGGGLSLVNDKLGPTQENTLSADLSYTIETSYRYKLSFGIKGSADFFSLDPNKLNPKNANDPSLQNFDNSFSPNVGAGIYFHSDQLYLGLSAPNLLETNRYNDNDVIVNKEKMNLYLIGGYVFDLSPSIKFKPAFLLKGVSGAPLQLDVSGNFMFNEKFVLGLAWRWSAAASAMAGFQITNGMYIGYGYDLETTKLHNYNSGSHEIFLRFELPNKMNRIVSPRFF